MKKNNDADAERSNYLSSSAGCNPVDVLRSFGAKAVVLVTLSVHDEGETETKAETTNNCIHTIWERVTQAYSTCAGHRSLWNTLFFVFAEEDILRLKLLFQDILASKECLYVTTRCILFEANESAEDLLMIVDDMLSEVNFKPNFGFDPRFVYRLVNHEEWYKQV